MRGDGRIASHNCQHRGHIGVNHARSFAKSTNSHGTTPPAPVLNHRFQGDRFGNEIRGDNGFRRRIGSGFR